MLSTYTKYHFLFYRSDTSVKSDNTVSSSSSVDNSGGWSVKPSKLVLYCSGRGEYIVLYIPTKSEEDYVVYMYKGLKRGGVGGNLCRSQWVACFFSVLESL